MTERKRHWMIEKTFTFDAAHHLTKMPPGHKCGRVHGHTYTLAVQLRTEALRDDDTVLDYAIMAEFVEPIVAELDHRCLNEVQGLESPTTEVICRWIFARLEGRLESLWRVVVFESSTTKCEYGYSE